MRTTLGILFGMIAALAIVAGMEWVETSLYPLPTLESADASTLAEVVADMVELHEHVG